MNKTIAKDMSEQEVIDFLVKCGMWVENGKIAKSDVNKAVSLLQNRATAANKIKVPDEYSNYLKKSPIDRQRFVDFFSKKYKCDIKWDKDAFLVDEVTKEEMKEMKEYIKSINIHHSSW